jgi:hypothetical protein
MCFLTICLECHLKGLLSSRLSYSSYSQEFVSDDTRGVERVEGSTTRFARQMIYSPKHITLELSSIVCREERQRVASMCGLLTAQCSHYQEQVSTSTNRHPV